MISSRALLAVSTPPTTLIQFDAMRSFKILLLRVARALGFFRLAQYLTRDRLRILCYHGFASGDEYVTAPYLFMRAETFAGRLRLIERRGLPVVSLDAGVRLLREHGRLRGHTVITFDDGWKSNLVIALPLLKQHAYTGCIYVTTEHFGHQPQVFNVVLTYMLLSSSLPELRLQGVHPLLDGDYDLGRHELATLHTLIKKAEQNMDFDQRLAALPKLAAALGIDLAEVLGQNRFDLLSLEEMTQLFQEGIDLQLHTHSHRISMTDEREVEREIDLNREAIATLAGQSRRHFCYPSGQYNPKYPDWLRKLGIESATTCDPGLNDRHSNPFLLKRYLDSETKHELEFDAEISGFMEIIKGIRHPFLSAT